MNCVRDFFREKPFVFFGTGMSCALDKRFGMPALQEHLSRSVVSEAQPSEQAQQKPPAALPDHGGGAENPEGGHALMNSLPENTFKNADRISWHEVTEVAHCWIDAATFTKPFKG